MQVIVYINDAGGAQILWPSSEFVDRYGIQAVAMKDVPQGKPFGIIDESELPQVDDWATWKVDPGTLTDGVGGNFTSFE